MAKFLYNGVKLPALPEWDKTAYPYAAIIRTGSSTKGYEYALILTRHALETIDSRFRLNHPDFVNASNAPWVYFLETEYIKADDDSWGAITTNSSQLILGYVFWTNYDMKDNDGDLRVARTTPLPVTELDPTTMVNGWLVGRAIAIQRKKPVPDGVLISSDGFYLQDSNGLYLIGKDDT